MIDVLLLCYTDTNNVKQLKQNKFMLIGNRVSQRNIKSKFCKSNELQLCNFIAVITLDTNEIFITEKVKWTELIFHTIVCLKQIDWQIPNNGCTLFAQELDNARSATLHTNCIFDAFQFTNWKFITSTIHFLIKFFAFGYWW